MIPHSKPWIDASDRLAVDQALASGMVAQGRGVASFERSLAGGIGAAGAVATSCGAAALELVLRALGIGAGDEVVVPTYVCVSVAHAVRQAGAAPVLCDVGEDWAMTGDSLRPALTARTAAVVVVHPFGISADMDGLARPGMPLIEDACQALGGRHAGRPLGSLGVASFFSFHATKCLCTGEGGAAATGDPGLLARMFDLRDGTERAAAKSGAACRLAAPMSDLQAALGLSQLGRYPAFLARRRQVADRYIGALAACGVALPERVRNRSMFFRFPVRTPGDFEATRQRFEERGVQVRRGVDALLHRGFLTSAGAFPVAERLFRETVSVPLYPAISDAEAGEVIDACLHVWGKA